ncbi:MAG TPA: aldose epimerase family protein [Rhodothermales bacterium]
MQTRSSASKEAFGTGPDGVEVERYVLRNARGMEVSALTYGCIITSIRVPDREGHVDDVVLGFDSLAPYLDKNPYFGAVIGRFGNRIGNARFELDGQTYQLQANNGPNHLHGGLRGFDKYVWNGAVFQNDQGVGVAFRRTSEDGEEGYPGRLEVEVTYTLRDDNTLAVAFVATTDRTTHVNLTQHSYFNLAGEGDVLNHRVRINADALTAVDPLLIPTGELRPVEGTPFDFREGAVIGDRIHQESDEQIARAGGFDHNFVINRNGASPGELVHAARAEELSTGRVLEVYTTEPGIQFYSGNFLNGSLVGKGDRRYVRRSGFCLETQHFPDSPNRPAFPSTVLRPGETYRSRTEFRFGTL